MLPPTAIYVVWSGLTKRPLDGVDVFVDPEEAERVKNTRNAYPEVSGACDWRVRGYYQLEE